MKMLKQLFNFYINSSIHVGLSVFSLTWITLSEYGLLSDKTILYFVFFASVSGYNFVKYFGMVKFHHRSLGNWLKAIQIFSFFSFIITCYYAYNLNLNTLIWIAGFGLMTFFYAIPLFPKQQIFDTNSLRNVEGLKVYLIAFVWMGVTVILPIINNDHLLSIDVIFTSAQRFIFVVVLMFPFEIRDLRYDSLKLATIPQKIGLKHTKILGILLMVLFFLIEFFKDEIDINKLVALTLITILTGLFLIGSKKDQGKYYCSFWVEGLPIFWLLMLLVLS